MDISWILRQIVDKTWARTYLGHIMDICRTYTGQGQKLDKLWDTYIDMEHRKFAEIAHRSAASSYLDGPSRVLVNRPVSGSDAYPLAEP